MKKQFFTNFLAKYVLPGILAIALPLGAFAQGDPAYYDGGVDELADGAFMDETARGIGAGLVLVRNANTADEPVIAKYNSAGSEFDIAGAMGMGDPGILVYDLSNADLSIGTLLVPEKDVEDSATNGLAMILAFDLQGEYWFSNVSVYGETASLTVPGGDVRGLMFSDIDVLDDTGVWVHVAGMFAGTIHGGDVYVNNVGATGNANAVSFWDAEGAAAGVGAFLDIANTADITFGNLNVVSQNSAWGFWAGGVEATDDNSSFDPEDWDAAKIQVGNVDVEGNSNYINPTNVGSVTGIRFDGNVDGGLLKVGNIQANQKGTGDAIGLHVIGNFTPDEVGFVDGDYVDSSIGTIIAESKGSAFGIRIEGAAQLLVDANITANATGNDVDNNSAFGIAVEGAASVGVEGSKVNATSAIGHAIGIEGGNGSNVGVYDGATVTATANGAGDATGVSVGANSIVDVYDATITAIATNGVATGIYANGDVMLWLGDDSVTTTITASVAEGGTGEAFGIAVNGNAAIDVYGNVDVSGTTSGIFVTGDLEIAIDNVEEYNSITNEWDFVANNELKSNITHVGGNLVVGELYGESDGSVVDLGALFIVGNISVNDGVILAVDITRSDFGTSNTHTIGADSFLGIYSKDGKYHDGTEWVDMTPGQLVYDFNNADSTWVFVDDIDEQLISWDPKFNWSFEDGVAIFGGLKGSLSMGDGRLAALGMHNRYAAWNAVRDRMISGSGTNRSGYFGQAPCDPACDPCDPACGSRSGGRNAWVNYIGRSDTYKSAFAGNNGANWKISSEGVQAGTDLFRNKRSQFGMLFGYEGTRARVVQDLVKSDDTYVGFYGARVLRNGADVRGSVAFGQQDYNMTRHHANGDIYTSSFKGNTSEINLEAGKRFARGAWSVRPVIGLDVMTNDLKAAQESAGTFSETYDKANLTQVFGRFGSDLRYQTRGITFNSGLYYAYNMNDRGLEARAGQMLINSTTLGRELITANLGATCHLSQSFSLFGGYEGQYTLDGDTKSAMNTGYAGVGFKW